MRKREEVIQTRFCREFVKRSASKPVRGKGSGFLASSTITSWRERLHQQALKPLAFEMTFLTLQKGHIKTCAENSGGARQSPSQICAVKEKLIQYFTAPRLAGDM